MITVLRKNQKSLWIVIGLLCIPFVFYFSNSNVTAIGHNELGQIYGRTVSNVELQRNARLLNLARDLGMMSFLQQMVAGAGSEEEAYIDFTWNHIVLHHEAKRLGIAASQTEIANVVKTLMPFRGENGFDPKKYDEFTQTVLPQTGFGEAQIEELVGDQIILDKLKQLVASGASVPEPAARENFERGYGKLSVAVVRVSAAEIGKQVQVSDEDVAKYYEAHKAELKSEEKRRVAVVHFALNEEQKKLQGKERVEALQKLADVANDFTQALLEKGAQFEQVAAKFKLPVQTTGDFTRSKPDSILGGSPQLVETAFRLRMEEPNSDAIQAGSDSFSVLHLTAIEEPKPLTREEAKPKIAETIKGERVKEMVVAKGAEAAQKLRQAVKSGTSLDAGLQATGLPAEKIPPFALADPSPERVEPGKKPEPMTLDLQTIKGAMVEMNPGEVSDFIQTPGGGLVAVLEKREKPAEAEYATSKALFSSRELRKQREIAFFEWMRERRHAAGVQTVVGGQAG